MQKTDEQLVRIMRDHGIVHPVWTLQASRHSGLDLSSACAMLTMETAGGANVFGHDPVRRGQIVGGKVTRVRYLRYKALRRMGYGNQGVGPCQLTSTDLQDAADNRGGCRLPVHNMEIGFEFLHGLQKQHGQQVGFQSYNGSGPRAQAYGKAAEALRKHFHELFT